MIFHETGAAKIPFEELTAEEKEKFGLTKAEADNAFENLSDTKSPVTQVGDEWNETSNNCEPYRVGWLEQKSASGR